MKLKEVKGTTFCSVCCRCGMQLNVRARFPIPQKIYSDQDGKPFQAFYCEKCKTELEGSVAKNEEV